MDYIVTSSIIVDGEEQAAIWSTSASESVGNSLRAGIIKSHSIRVDPMEASEVTVDDRVMALTEYLTAPVALQVLEEFIRKSESQWTSSPNSSAKAPSDTKPGPTTV